ncbi:MAG: peptidoglycan-binding protein, partial [Patescibacteria group bacterium]|nr:peptidoglycan-binding protein [Patescibacteria group bacterium]
MQKCLLIKILSFLILFFVLLKSSLGAARISESHDVNLLSNNWFFDGSIEDIITTPQKIFVAGNFSYVGPYKGNAFLINTNNNLSLDLVDKIDGIVWEAIPDGNGGWYVGGDFNKVGSYSIKKLAHILSDGKVNPNFSFDISETVYAIARKDNILFIGGAFENIENTGINYLAAIDLSNNSLVENFKIFPDDYVFDLVVDPERDKLYVAGQFISLWDQIRMVSSSVEFLSAINIGEQFTVDEGFNFYFDDIVSKLLLSQNGNRLYVSGYFKKVGQLSRGYLTAIDLANNQILANFNPNPDYVVLAMAESSDRNYLYVGGRFRSIGGGNVNYLAKISSSTGNIVSNFDCRIDSDDNETDIINSVLDLKIDSSEQLLYVGGAFRRVSNRSKPFFFVASIANNYCRLVDEIDFEASNLPNSIILNNLNINDRVNILSLANNRLFIGGRFSSYGGFNQKYLAAFDKLSYSFDHNFRPSIDRPVHQLAFDSAKNQLYFSGYFSQVNGVNRNFIASLNLNNYSLTNFNVNISTSSGEFISKFILEENNLYLAGSFRRINGRNLKYLAKVDSITGQVDENFVPPDLRTPPTSLAIKDNFLYVGGKYLNVLNKNSGSILLNFSISGQINDIFVDANNNLLFIGGNFIQPSKNFSILNANTGNIINGNYSTNKPVFRIKGNDNINLVFVGGYFDSFITTSSPINSFFILNYDNSNNFNLLRLNLNFDNFIYSAYFDADVKKVYLVGNFSASINSRTYNNILAFDIHLPETTTPLRDNRDERKTISVGTGGGGGGDFTVPSQQRQTTLTATTSNDELLRLWLLQFILQQQKATTQILESTPTPFASKIESIPPNFRFTRSLRLGMRGVDVRYLKIFLKAQGKSIYPEGRISDVFDTSTQRAVIRFQRKYQKELKIRRPDGIVRGATLRKINEMIRGR